MILSGIIQGVFWLSVAALLYTYIGYPMLVYLISRLFPREIKRDAFEPYVTVIITAYNEEQDIAAKLQNTLQIDYPQEKFEILVASDGSTDRTDEIVESFAAKGVSLFHQEGRHGKTFTQNKAVELAKGEVIIFSDATTMYSKDVLREILPNFADETIGCVAGRLIYHDPNESDVGTGAKSYWGYETFLKYCESRACSLIGVSGCLYAVRKSAYRPMYPEACSDFLIATVVYEQGLRTIYEPRAICFEETNEKADKELQMRIRVISQTFTDLWRNRKMMNPLKEGFYAVELFSHKLLRYSVPLFLLLILVSSGILALSGFAFASIFLLQIVFYSIAVAAWVFERSGKQLGFFAFPLYFVLANIASAIGFYKFLSGKRYASWEPSR